MFKSFRKRFAPKFFSADGKCYIKRDGSWRIYIPREVIDNPIFPFEDRERLVVQFSKRGMYVKKRTELELEDGEYPASFSEHKRNDGVKSGGYIYPSRAMRDSDRFTFTHGGTVIMIVEEGGIEIRDQNLYLSSLLSSEGEGN